HDAVSIEPHQTGMVKSAGRWKLLLKMGGADQRCAGLARGNRPNGQSAVHGGDQIAAVVAPLHRGHSTGFQRVPGTAVDALLSEDGFAVRVVLRDASVVEIGNSADSIVENVRSDNFERGDPAGNGQRRALDCDSKVGPERRSDV